jgi:hypothetical protein
MVMLGRETFAYDASRMIVYSVDLPVASQVVRARSFIGAFPNIRAYSRLNCEGLR